MNTIKRLSEIIKNALDAVQSMVLVGLVLVIVFGPSYVNAFLDRLNVSKIEYGGVTIDRQKAVEAVATVTDALPKVEAELGKANTEIKALRSKYEEASASLTKAEKELTGAHAEGATRPEAAQRQLSDVIANVQSTLRATVPALQAANQAENSAQRAVQTTQQAIQSLPKASDKNYGFAVVFGANKQRDNADRDLAAAKANGFPDAKIFTRQGFYRTVAVYPDKQKADAALPEIRQVSGAARDAYVVNLANWCPEPKPESDGTLNCGI